MALTIFRTALNWGGYLNVGTPQETGNDHLKVFTDILAAIQSSVLSGAAVVNELSVAPVANAVALGNNFVDKAIVAVIGEDATTGMPVSIAGLLDPATGIQNGTFNERMALQSAINNADWSKLAALAVLTNWSTADVILNLTAGHNLSKVHFYYMASTSTLI